MYKDLHSNILILDTFMNVFSTYYSSEYVFICCTIISQKAKEMIRTAEVVAGRSAEDASEGCSRS